MTYLLLKTTQQPRIPWTEEEKLLRLRELIKEHDLLLPDDFYTPALSAQDLDQMLNKLIKHLGLRGLKVLPRFSENISEAGRCEIEAKTATLIIHSRFIGNPFACAAILAHNLCHYVLMVKHDIYFNDMSENEKVADLATLQGGLGLIVLNGALTPGWLSLLMPRKANKNHWSGYLHTDSYGQLFRSYLNDQQVALEKVVPYIVPWSRRLIGAYPRTPNRSLPPFIKHADLIHKRSLQRFWLLIITLLVFVGSLTFVLMQRPAYLSDELRLQKQKVDDLAVSYQGCVDRIERIKQDYDEDDASTKRYIDNELTKCKSLQNRHNHEANIYNMMRKTYE